jgi:hypothetical protein
MSLKFQHGGYRWTLREGFPPAGSRERQEPLFSEALQRAYPPLAKLTQHELASWIVARLDFITAGALTLEGEEFAHDTNEFGFKIRLANQENLTLAHGAIVITTSRTYLAFVSSRIDDFQSVIIDLLIDAPDDLAKCEIIVLEPESRKRRCYGWNGHALLNRRISLVGWVWTQLHPLLSERSGGLKTSLPSAYHGLILFSNHD